MFNRKLYCYNNEYLKEIYWLQKKEECERNFVLFIKSVLKSIRVGILDTHVGTNLYKSKDMGLLRV